MLFVRRVVVGVTIVAAAACGSSFEPGVALTGSWGGRDLVADLTTTGGTLDLSCNFGELNAPLVPDNMGRVSSDGYTVRVGGAPLPTGSVAQHVPVQVNGQVNGGHLTLYVRALGVDYVDSPPRYDVVRGAAGNVLRCP